MVVLRAASSQAVSLIEDGGFERVWVADLLYDGERRLANVPVADVDLRWDGGQFVVGSGSLTVVWSDDFGSSMFPAQIGDLFSPFGAELQVDCIVRAGNFSERIPQGRFVIDSVAGLVSSRMPFQGRAINPGESFRLELKDSLVRVQREEFLFPVAAGSTSAWQEIGSVSRMPLVRNVPDAAVPAGTSYVDDRGSVLSRLFDLLGAWPHTDPSGALRARPKAWPAPVDEIRGVVSAPVVMESARTYNRVLVEGEAPDGTPLYGKAEVSDGFLRVLNRDGSASPFGVSTYRYASKFLTSQSAVAAYARELLPRVSRVRGVARDVSEPFNPLREVGDVLVFEGGLVRVRQVSHSGAVTNSVVEVPDE